ncbi:MAG TPA: GNAT family N-acetyltransferase [Vicinamibacterales bacterium]|nr:GNAT family N-acetyltransferase [Vicinamibacterales bacterium]
MSTSPLTIRPARHDDEEFLLRLLPRLADFPLPAWRTADEIARGDRQILVDALYGRLEHAAILVAESMPGGERAGYVFATTKHDYFTRAAHAHVEVIAVEEGAERRGVARSLMDAVEQWAKRRGYGWVTLNVFDRNSRARALYDRLGYLPETIHYRKDV